MNQGPLRYWPGERVRAVRAILRALRMVSSRSKLSLLLPSPKTRYLPPRAATMHKLSHIQSYALGMGTFFMSA